MTWNVAVAGTLDLNDITTPHGRRSRLLGGSAVYFALAARTFAPVYVHGRVGGDAAKEFADLLGSAHVNTEGVHPGSGPTRMWRARHDFEQWIAIAETDDNGFGKDWGSGWDRSLTSIGRDAQVLFLGSMPPKAQLAVLEQSRARLIGSDTMANFAGDDQRADVDAVIAGSHIFFANRHELAAITNEFGDWREAARGLLQRTANLRAIVVKGGPDGAALVTRDSIIERSAAAVPTVIDPTGAGDSLAGGFLGFCAQRERDDQGIFLEALGAGLKTAAAAIAWFGTEGLTSSVGSNA